MNRQDNRGRYSNDRAHRGYARGDAAPSRFGQIHPNEGSRGGRRSESGRVHVSHVRRGSARRRRIGPFQRMNAALKRMRRDEASAIVVNSVLIAAVLVMALGVLALCWPHINLARTGRLIHSGDYERAESAILRLSNEGYPEERVNQLRYQLADFYLSAANYDRLYALLTTLPENERTREIERQGHYAEAGALYASGDYDAAARLFYQLGDFSDSAQRAADARAAIAIREALDGDTAGADQILMGIADTYLHVQTAAQAVGGSAEAAERILSMETFSRQRLDQMERDVSALVAARAESVEGRIACGDRHTVALCSDGTVLATGDNTSGQCEVSGWSDIIQIAAGAKHTVGLRSDGTVVAAGDNSYKQCDVSQWSGIRQIAANAYGTLGLKQDGTVVASSYYSDQVSGWSDVTRISGGAYSAGCLYGQGNMICTHKTAQLGLNAVLTSLSVCGPVSAGLRADGSLVTSLDSAPDWHALRQVVVTQTGLLAVALDGRVLSYTFRDAETQSLTLSATPVEIAGSGTHVVVLLDNGTAVAFGEKDAGQCEVGGWTL